MTTASVRLADRPPPSWGRRSWAIVAVAALAASIVHAGVLPSEILNTRGWGQVENFITAMWNPRLDSAFLELTIRESAVTLSYSLLGTAVGLAIGLVGGVILTERIWLPLAGPMARGRAGWALSRLAFAIPRSMHEVVFALFLVNILGLNPLVAILSMGVPFGAVTAKVFAELLDEVPRDSEMSLRASGAGRFTALAFGAFPFALGDLLSYSFYRFECGIRSAAVLGFVGAGGLGFQLALSFQSLRYDEMWTLLWALIILSGIADRWSSAVRRRRNSAAIEMHLEGDAYRRVPRRDPFILGSAALATVMVPISVWWLDVDITTLWNRRARTLTRELIDDALPPRIGRGGWSELLTDSLDTVALAVLSIALAWTLASAVAFVASRPLDGRVRHREALARAALGTLLRFVLLVCRSVPPPVWALIVVFVLFPGLWPGAVALAIYNLGVLGRLQGEVVENIDRSPEQVLRATGATSAAALAYATVPAVSGRFVALGLYRWEVAIRETVVVGVVGAAGLGRRLDEQASAFDYRGIVATVLALIVVTVAVDLASASVRRTLR